MKVRYFPSADELVGLPELSSIVFSVNDADADEAFLDAVIDGELASAKAEAAETAAFLTPLRF